jgi:hypothetical protein
MTRKCFLTLLTLILRLEAHAQETIRLENPSFENARKHAVVPNGWYNCGDPEESPPDVQPGFFGCELKPADGKSYLGLVARDNGTTEALGQALSDTLKTGTKYVFHLYLARSRGYLSWSKTYQKEDNFDTPVALKIWAGNDLCHKGELLAETVAVEHALWLAYKFEFVPETGNWTHLMFEAAFSRDRDAPYNGNILIDHCSALVKTDEK